MGEVLKCDCNKEYMENNAVNSSEGWSFCSQNCADLYDGKLTYFPEHKFIEKEKCGYCSNGNDPDEMCKDCWDKMNEVSE